MIIKPNSVYALTHPLSKMHVARNFRKSHHPIEALTYWGQEIINQLRISCWS